MPKLYSNPWKNKLGVKARVLGSIRGLFYTWLLRKYCKGCKTVIDVACGPAQFMKTAKKLGFKAKGVDADGRYKGNDVEIGNLWNIAGKYDVVFNSMIIEHMHDQEKFVKKMAMLSNRIVITLSAYHSRKFWDVPDHVRPVTKVSVRWLFRRHGFKNLLSIHVPFYKAVVVVSRKVKSADKDKESAKIKAGYW